MSAKPSYPEPPWDTRGFAVVAPQLVSADAARVPEELEPLSGAGRCLGALVYVEYTAPSPLSYRELIWMPTLVRPRRGARTERGWYVAKIYVDDLAAHAAGRELWALPKEMARFERRGQTVEMHAEDGTEVSLSFRRLGPAVSARRRVATLQPGDGPVRLRVDCRARVAPAWLRVDRLSSSDERWLGLAGTRPWGGPAAMLPSFEATMRPPEFLSPPSTVPRPMHAA